MMAPHTEESSDPSSPDQASENNESIKDASAATADGSSYWDAPKETSLKGKTLSTLDLTTLESNHPEIQQQKTDSYWEATPEKSLEGKTLSTLDIDMLGNPADDEKNSQVAAPSPENPKPVVIADEPNETTPSYWDAPKESTLRGKTLSTLDLVVMESNHPDQQKLKTDDYWGGTPKEDGLKGRTISSLDMTVLDSNHPDEKKEKNDSYWEVTPKEECLEGKTLSTLSMSQLEANHPDEKKEKTDSYWEAPIEKKLQGKTLSTIDMTTLETTGPPSATTTEESDGGAASYWDEPIDKTLEGKRLSSIDMVAMGKQHLDKKPQAEAPATPYWDWKIKAIKKTLSKISLSNLRKGSRDDVELDDRVHGGISQQKPSATTGESSVKPITKKTHKLRDSWRMSFHQMSTNTLDQLDESNGSGPRLLGKRMFKSRNALDRSGGSACSQGSTGGGITF